jgi:hypothetical protein
MNKRKVASTNDLSSTRQPETLPDDAVLFNPLHDHESVWWIPCWALLHYIPIDHNPESDEKPRERIEFARRIFHPTVFAPKRNEVLSLGLPKTIITHVPSEFEWLVDMVSVRGRLSLRQILPRSQINIKLGINPAALPRYIPTNMCLP